VGWPDDHGAQTYTKLQGPTGKFPGFPVGQSTKCCIQICHHLREDKTASNKYDQYVVYLAILNYDVIDMFCICSHLQ